MDIYLITNLVDDKKYVGITTKTYLIRYNEHINNYKQHKKNYHLYNAMSKYGIDNFKVELLETVLDIDELKQREIYYISIFNTFNDGYNMTLGGDGAFGRKHSEESKEKNRLKHLGKSNPHTEESKQKISIANKGKKRTEEYSQKMSELKKGMIPWNKGFKNCFNEEAIQKMSESHKGYKMTEEAKKKISEFNKGKIISEEQKANISKLKMGNTYMLGKNILKKPKRK